MIRDLLLPETDAGVVVQAALVAGFAIVVISAAWRHPELRVLAVGVSLVAAGLLGLRALH